jgi:hypothetical protein
MQHNKQWGGHGRIIIERFAATAELDNILILTIFEQTTTNLINL